MTGLRVPAAKGAMVRGTKPTATSLFGGIDEHISFRMEFHRSGMSHAPLERPVVATVRGVRMRDGSRVVHCKKGTTLIFIIHVHFVDDCSRYADSRKSSRNGPESTRRKKNLKGEKDIPVP